MASSHNTVPPVVLNEFQEKTCIALCDTIMQAHTGEEAERILQALPKDGPKWQREAARTFVTSSFSQLPNAMALLKTQFANSLSPTNQAELLLALTILSTRAGTFVLTSGYARPFYELDVKEREEVMKAWSNSSLLTRRKTYSTFQAFTLLTAYTAIGICTDAVGYPTMDRRLLSKPLRAPTHRYTFLTPTLPYETLHTEVLIIGSGSGGGVAASVLSGGYKCLVLEKGVYAPTGERSRSQVEGFNELYERGGFLISEEGSISVLAGSVFGGGSTINWSGSLKPQHFTRAAWAKQYGLEHFLSDEFTNSLDKVCERMGVSSKHIKYSKANQGLIDGSNKLGYHVDAIPQNTSGEEHSCGFCSFGCPYGEKQGSPETWMVDAAKNGAEFMDRAQVTRLLFTDPLVDHNPTITESNISSYLYSSSNTKCIGAEVALDNGTKVIVRASKAVVCSGGSINSPAILMRSGLKNKRIGANLHLHPCAYVTGEYEEKIDPWDGSIMTAVSNVVENKDGAGFGCKLEVLMSFPGGHATAGEAWKGSADHKARMLRYNNSFSFITLTRDRDSGSITLDKDGGPRINYKISEYDAQSMLKGIIAGCEVHLAAGAKRIITSQAGVTPYIVEPGSKGLVDPRWKAWIKQVETIGVHPNWTTMGSAHQMGTCAMGVSPSTSVIDPRGRVWGTESLYVADASTFPTASGVNPMVTTMGVSYSIAGFIAEDLAAAPKDKQG